MNEPLDHQEEINRKRWRNWAVMVIAWVFLVPFLVSGGYSIGNGKFAFGSGWALLLLVVVFCAAPVYPFAVAFYDWFNELLARLNPSAASDFSEG